MALEVVPDLFSRIEFRCVTRKTLKMKSRIGIANRVDGRALVDLTSIPKQDDVAAQVTEQHAKELCDLDGFKIVLTKLDVQPHSGSFGRNSECRDG